MPTSTRGEDLRLILSGTSVTRQLPAEHICRGNAEPLGWYLPEMHRDLCGVDHQFVADAPECDRKPFLEMKDYVIPGCDVPIIRLLFQKLVAPCLQFVEYVAGYNSLLAYQL